MCYHQLHAKIGRKQILCLNSSPFQENIYKGTSYQAKSIWISQMNNASFIYYKEYGLWCPVQRPYTNSIVRLRIVSTVGVY